MKQMKQIYIQAGHWPVSRRSSPLSASLSSMCKGDPSPLGIQSYATSVVSKFDYLPVTLRKESNRAGILDSHAISNRTDFSPLYLTFTPINPLDHHPTP